MIKFDAVHADAKQPDASYASGCFVVLHDLHVRLPNLSCSFAAI